MTGDKVIAASVSGDAVSSVRGRERSTIEFPYGDLNDAIEVARAIHLNAGTSCTPDQLAGYMGQMVSSGAFRLKISAARVFGLVETERGGVTLTTLGRQIVDQGQEREARSTAFLNVPLYRAIYEKFKGHMLPPRAALEREMASLGVSAKQTDRARQAFERSADQAAFFAHGADRLVIPSGLSRPETAPLEGPQGLRKSGNGSEDEPPLHPFIKGLLETLPVPQSEWSITDRAKWLETAASIFGLIYKGGGSIKIVVGDAA